MTNLPAALIVPGCLLFFFQGSWSRSPFSPSADVSCISMDCMVNISCLIIDLKYVDCNWTKAQMQQINYTFSSKFSHDSFRECPEYLQEHGQTVGCRIPLEDQMQRFNPFSTKLSVGGNRSIYKNYTDLKQRVKLNPPYNLSVNASDRDGEVCARWTVRRTGIMQNCERYKVGYQKASGSWKFSTDVPSSPYCISPVSSRVMYTFKVQRSISTNCGGSEFWSDWSNLAQWGENKAQPPVYWQVFGSVLAVLILIGLSLLLYYSERIKVVFVPVTPDPSKSLQDLFKKHNGNVESWVYISRELKDAFETDYTETPCVVCESSPTLETKTVDGPMEQPVS
ncbi:interleukin 2 receptor, gamma b [Neoarius graeffei]|uniref:interleukin 2 receptor, gamma b n=1 Tax=Neoarius graeffei TaxID=443677 RepID=UPI00298D154D|nr:interleukin 2 receptor, gamma b [Neoarius graeffei]